MRVTLLLLVGLVWAGDAKDDEAKKELKKFEGTWVLESGEKEGKKLPPEEVKKGKIVWKGAEVIVESPHQSKEPIKATTIHIDPVKKEMDWKRANGPDAGKTMRATYEWIDKDHYRIVFAPGDKERPKEFSTKPGSGHIVHSWKRVKE
jgi:uncharacterized protein (TIGR03067 family)